MSDGEKTALDLELEAKEKAAAEENATRTGVGTRKMVGKTRGRGVLVIEYEAFDESKPDTLPKTIQQFMETTKVSDEPTLVGYLIDGFNQANYTAASDPLAEFVDPSWPDDAKTQFRLVVRNYSRGANVSLDDAVALIKPGFSKQFAPAAQA
jgi:hypothetical protein